MWKFHCKVSSVLLASICFLNSQTALSLICPELTHQQLPVDGWSTMAMGKPTLPASFFSARYILGFGLMEGLVLCDYVDQNKMPFSQMSNEYRDSPNPQLDAASPWKLKTSPFKHLECKGNILACQF